MRTRSRYISLVGACVRREGFWIATGSAEAFGVRVEKLGLPEELHSEIAPLMEVMKSLNEQIRSLDKVLEKLKEEDEEVGRLCTVPSIGPVTAAAVVSALDDAKRFRGAHQVEAYLGLVPMERSSGEKQRKGSITKAGNRRGEGRAAALEAGEDVDLEGTAKKLGQGRSLRAGVIHRLHRGTRP